ncbi:Zinc-binding domain protein [Francisella tularensis subsp. holarctica F92]|nr:Zinc-binding domain protein [Francisella tularensis subsp. holarctica F92]
MSNYSDQDIFFMQKAYQQALLAYQAGEVPIGAVLVRDDQ